MQHEGTRNIVNINLTAFQSPYGEIGNATQGLPVSTYCADLYGAFANLGCFSFK